MAKLDMSTGWKQMAPRKEPVAKSYDFALQRRETK
jgi:hypothetical protein